MNLILSGKQCSEKKNRRVLTLNDKFICVVVELCRSSTFHSESRMCLWACVCVKEREAESDSDNTNFSQSFLPRQQSLSFPSAAYPSFFSITSILPEKSEQICFHPSSSAQHPIRKKRKSRRRTIIRIQWRHTFIESHTN